MVNDIEISLQKVGFSVPMRNNATTIANAKARLFCSSRTRKPLRKTLVQGVSGTFKSGELWAVMGPSGSGKSTLLNLIGNRLDGGFGKVAVDGIALTRETSRQFGFVMQEDYLHENLSVRETLEYVVQLRQGFVSRERLDSMVSGVIADLGLEACAETRVLNCSGGEKKRVSIGIELLKDNSRVLLLDEPTSGLDSSTALQIVSILRKLANSRNQLVICTIHQPQSKIYKMFDNLLLLSQGKTIYMGSAEAAPAYFAELGYPCRTYTNPSDHMLELISLDASSFEAELDSLKRISKLAGMYTRSDLNLNNSLTSSVFSTSSDSTESWHNWKAWQCWGEWPTFLILTMRNFKDQYRSKSAISLRAYQCILLSLMLGAFFWNLGNDLESIYDRQGALFYIVVQQACASLLLVVTMFQSEKEIFFREHSQGLYSSATYFLSKVLSELPFVLIPPVVFTAIAFPMLSLAMAYPHFNIGVATLIMVSFAAQGLGLLLSAASPSQGIAQMLTPVVIVFLLLFGGLFVNESNIPVYFSWVSYVNYIKLGYEILSVDQLAKLQITCSPDTLARYNGQCPMTNGNQVLTQMSMQDVNINSKFASLLTLSLAFYLMAYLTLKLKTSKRK